MKPAEAVPWSRVAVRVVILALPLAAAGLFIADVERALDTGLRNVAPLALTLVFAAASLVRNRGHWWQPDARWPLVALGFAVPVVGLSVYLHVLWHYDIDGLRSEARDPRLLFAWLPVYTLLAGLIGGALGWIVGRQVNEIIATRDIAKSGSQ